MSTKIRDAERTYGPHCLDGSGGNSINFVARGLGQTVTATMTRTDFLAAVEAECGVRLVPADAIVIDRSEIPEVIDLGAGSPLKTRPLSPEDDTFNPVRSDPYLSDAPNARPEWHRGRAVAHLALAEHLAAHPPVDEAQVQAIADLLLGHMAFTADEAARRLVAAGARIEVTR